MDVRLSDDPYKILGVPRTATAGQIRDAYRKLARKLHPDLNPGDKGAEERFKKVSAAYDLLGDPAKRARFDRGEIDASGAERPPEPPPHRAWSRQRGAEAYSDPSAFADIAGADDVLADLLGRGFRFRDGTGLRMPGPNISAHLSLPFLDAVLGSTQRLVLPDDGTVEVKVPAGTASGDVLRLAGKGGAGIGGAPAGDLLITIEVLAHARFRREGDDIVFDLPVDLATAVLGGRLEVEAPGGRVRVTVPEGANSGTVLRLRGRGVPKADGTRGDALARLVISLPDPADPALRQFVQSWRKDREGGQ